MHTFMQSIETHLSATAGGVNSNPVPPAQPTSRNALAGQNTADPSGGAVSSMSTSISHSQKVRNHKVRASEVTEWAVRNVPLPSHFSITHRTRFGRPWFTTWEVRTKSYKSMSLSMKPKNSKHFRSAANIPLIVMKSQHSIYTF